MKTIHFNCPICDRPVETPAYMSGKLTQCPGCEENLRPPCPAPKTSPAWLIAVCFVLMASSVCIGIPLEQWAATNSPKKETPLAMHKRFQTEARAMFLRQCTNSIAGMNRVSRKALRISDDNPNKWTAEVSAEYVNRFGGIERKDLPFVFWVYSSPVDNLPHVLCRVDNLEIYDAQHGIHDGEIGLTFASRN
jgi:hypothetical protein